MGQYDLNLNCLTALRGDLPCRMKTSRSNGLGTDVESEVDRKRTDRETLPSRDLQYKIVSESVEKLSGCEMIAQELRNP
jgi:hypothetical protein